MELITFAKIYLVVGVLNFIAFNERSKEYQPERATLIGSIVFGFIFWPLTLALAILFKIYKDESQ